MTAETGFASRRRSVCAGLTALLTCLLIPGIVSAQGTSDVPGPGAEAFQAALAASAAQEPSLPDPTAAEIAASEDAFTNLSDSDALDLAKDEFAEIVHAQLIPELDLDPDQAVDEYLGRYTALVTDDDAPTYFQEGEVNTNSLVESALPLRAPEGGTQRPLDAELEQQGDHFEADNSVVNAEIPAELDEGVEIPTADVTVTPAGTDQADAVPVADKVFYPNAAEDTDYMIAPTATGAEIFIQLRSEQSPESFPIDLAMPDGATLQATDDGGAVVESGGETILSVDPPIAVDAAGAKVSVDYTIAGDRLSVEVPRGAASDYLYPIMVDPIYGVYDEYNWGQGGQSNVLDTKFWSWTSSNTNHYLMDPNGPQAGGVGTIASAPHNYNAGSWGEWLAASIGNSYIERVDFINMTQFRTEPGNPTVLALWTPAGWVTSTVDYDDPGTPGGRVYPVSTATLEQTQYTVSRTMWAGQSYTPDGSGGDAEAPDGSVGVFALTSNAGQRTNPAHNLLKSAHIWRYDRYGPSAPSIVSPTPATAWTNKYVFRVQDSGLGVSGVWIWGPNWTIPGTGTANCTGAHQQPCGSDVPVEVTNLPEGVNNYTAMGIDPVQNGGPGLGFTAKFDKTAPTVQLSGTLSDAAAAADPLEPNEGYSLHVHATDVSSAPTGAQTSGVQSIEILDQAGTRLDFVPQSCNVDGCSLDRDWTLQVGGSPGTNRTFKVRVTDYAGNVSTQDLNVSYVNDYTVGEEAAVGVDSSDNIVAGKANMPGVGIAGFHCGIAGPWYVNHETGTDTLNSYSTWFCAGGAQGTSVASVRVKTCIEHKRTFVIVSDWPDDKCKEQSYTLAEARDGLHETSISDDLCDDKDYRASNKLTLVRPALLDPSAMYKSYTMHC